MIASYLRPITIVILLVILCGIRYADPWFLNVMRFKALDSHQRIQETQLIDNIVTIEINNDTLESYGQWPFPRNVLAHEIRKLYDHGAGLVILPMLLAEPDRFGMDADFTKMLAETPTIIGQVPGKVQKGNPVTRGVSAIGVPWEGWLYKYPEAIGPLKEFADAAIGVGMLVISPEADGVVRRVPLAVDINGEIYPSMSMEIIRTASGDVSYQIKTGEAGVEALRIPKYGITKTDPNGNIWVDFRYKTEVIPLHTELPDLTNKIVILSLTASGLDSVVATPVGNMYNHDLLAATATTMMSNTNITRPWWSDITELSVSFGMGLIIALTVLIFKWYAGAILLPVFILGSFYGSLYVFNTKSYLLDWSWPILTVFVVWASAAFMRFMHEYKEKMAIKKQFAGYASPTVVRMLQENPKLIKDGMKRDVSICFSDLRGFTPLGESFGDDVKGLTLIMNGYMDAITQPILDADGMVIKYIGDASMHIHNAPIDDPDHPKSAVRTGILMLRAVEKFNDKIVAEGRPPVGMGAGINTGLGYIGEMGSTARHSYDILGDAVSTAARIESKCKEYGCLLLVGGATVEKCDDEFFFLKVDDLAVKGKTVGIAIYTVLYDIKTHYNASLSMHNEMHSMYQQQKFRGAIEVCETLKPHFDGKLEKYYDMWIERCEYMETQDLPTDWNGVFIATTK